jgi:hypothetical protein
MPAFTIHEESLKSNSVAPLLTLLSDLFFLWVLFYFGLGGWEGAVFLLTRFGVLPWAILAGVLFLLLYRSDFRTDLPLFAAGFALGYWGEWWGTTRGVWAYWNSAAPPDYLPPLWGIGLLTVYRLSLFLSPWLKRGLPRGVDGALKASFVVLPLLALARSWPLLAVVDWRARLDAHFFAGLVVAAVLILYRFDLRQAFPLYLCGTLLGGVYEYLGTAWGEWAYITGEVPPLWIAPLWGLAAVAMVKLALGVRSAGKCLWSNLLVQITPSQANPKQVDHAGDQRSGREDHLSEGEARAFDQVQDVEHQDQPAQRINAADEDQPWSEQG